ncbi:hypothetical protein B0H13DRAFT_1871069 [Mycena leptocephala]|nr:hypothetical protein B0H13DRAFT_1871069 [Mycena leptocephala]
MSAIAQKQMYLRRAEPAMWGTLPASMVPSGLRGGGGGGGGGMFDGSPHPSLDGSILTSWSDASKSIPSATAWPEQISSSASQLGMPSSNSLGAFYDEHPNHSISLTFREVAQAIFKTMVEQRRTDNRPAFTALGRFIGNDGLVLQWFAYQQSDVSALAFDVSEDYVDGLEPLIPNWMALQQRTAHSMSPHEASFVELVQSSPNLHQVTEICTLDTGEKIPLQLVQPGNSDAVVQPHHSHDFLFEFNRPFLSKILKQFRAVDKYLAYFVSLAEIEERAAECSGVVSYGATTYSEMTKATREAATGLFGSVASTTDLMHFATVEEVQKTMPNDQYLACWCREVAQARGVPVEAGLKDGIPTLIPRFTPPDIVRQVDLYHSVKRKKPFCLNI